MPTKLPLLYLDTCVFIAWLMNEQRKNLEETRGISEIMQLIDNNKVRMITSAVTTAEVLRCTLSTDAKRDLANVFLRRNVAVMNTDQQTWALTHDLRDYYQQLKAKDNLPTLSTPDAIHLATAIQYEADKFYTFDEKDKPGRSRALLPLNGNVAGYELEIVKPLGTPDLFANMTSNEQEEDQQE